MDWTFRADAPIYTQLCEQLTLAIVSGVYAAGDRLPTVRDIAARYGVTVNIRTFTLPIVNSPTWYLIRRDDSENARANLEYALDVEDNDLQQDMITMQGLIGKRDNSFSTAAKVIKKVDGTADSILRTIGQ